jgi:hypothetical protein
MTVFCVGAMCLNTTAQGQTPTQLQKKADANQVNAECLTADGDTDAAGLACAAMVVSSGTARSACTDPFWKDFGDLFREDGKDKWEAGISDNTSANIDWTACKNNITTGDAFWNGTIPPGMIVDYAAATVAYSLAKLNGDDALAHYADADEKYGEGGELLADAIAFYQMGTP